MRYLLRPIALIVLVGLLLTRSPMDAAAQTEIVRGVDELAWNADGSLLAFAGIGSTGKEIQIWERSNTTTEDIWSRGYTYPAPGVAFVRTIEAGSMASLAWHPTEPAMIAIASLEGTVDVLDVVTDTAIVSMQALGAVQDLDWNPTGDLLALGVGTFGGDEDAVSGIELRDISGELVDRIEIAARRMTMLAWSPDGSQIAFTIIRVDEFAAGVWTVDTAMWNRMLSMDAINVSTGPDLLPWYPMLPMVTWSPAGELVILNGGGVLRFDPVGGTGIPAPLTVGGARLADSISWNENTGMAAIGGPTGITVFHPDYARYAGTVRSVINADVSEVDWNPVTGQLTFVIDGMLEILTPPTADAGPDQTVQADSSGYANVTLDGTASVAANGFRPMTYTWHVDDYTPVTGAAPVLSLPEGEHTIVLVVTNIDGMIAVDMVTITVEIPPASA